MSTTSEGSGSGFDPEPEDWPAPDPAALSPEALQNDPDDVAAALPVDAALPSDADEADVLDQRTESGIDLEGDDEEQ